LIIKGFVEQIGNNEPSSVARFPGTLQHSGADICLVLLSRQFGVLRQIDAASRL